MVPERGGGECTHREHILSFWALSFAGELAAKGKIQLSGGHPVRDSGGAWKISLNGVVRAGIFV